jgi:biotin-dependent carboxylase-like uncharacterized protein
MTRPALVIRRSGHAVVQDLGRPGLAHLGIAGNGAADQHAARVANILVGNADHAPLLEATASELAVTALRPLLVAVTGAPRHVLVDGRSLPAWETLALHSGATLTVPAAEVGIRSYLAINGAIEGSAVLGSVAPDALYGVGRRLHPDDEVRIDTHYRGPIEADPLSGVFRFGAEPIAVSEHPTIDVTAGPDLLRLRDDAAWLGERYTVAPESDHVGLRLSGPLIEQNVATEILSRGVPVGAVEVPSSSGLIVLLRARLLTAGYPVIAVVTTAALDRLGQVGPGYTVEFAMCDMASARAELRTLESQRDRLADRVCAALVASGLGGAVDPGHRGLTRRQRS